MKNEKKFPKKGIIWNQVNEGLIKEYLDEAQKRAKVRLCDIEDFRYLLRKIDESDAIRGISNKDKHGMEFALDPYGQTFPKAYYKKGSPVSTKMYVRFNGRNWTVKDICRGGTNRTTVYLITTLSQEQKNAVAISAIDNI